jgi:hypothetical protein
MLYNINFPSDANEAPFTLAKKWHGTGEKWHGAGFFWHGTTRLH